ncbi:hypothetical protein LOAG_10104 [Loa loa]|uniref:RING-type domain-containing protein n=1 Tax=Loa loa TaxID=7209 RepID=A0A1S0TRS1_LOALO|nr:hypothetical protein LOAG_10104 [Loa loa]EFO18389.1 hypothetical protein LOAG_10104 [Loa loa]
MFEVEALRDSREFSESRFGEVSAVQGTTTGKETILANLGPLADLVDQYASVCNEVISLFAHVILRSRHLRRYSLNCGAEDLSRITCCICFIHEKSILLQPCNHICVCAYCVEELLETYEEPLCPLCRSVITSYVDVYI